MTTINDEGIVVSVAYPEYTPTKTHASDVNVLAASGATKSAKFTVSEEGMGHIMSLLTDLYSNPERSVLREYVSNAYDSHVEARQSRPIEVTMPSSLNPSLVIEDFGLGMSEREVLEVYSSYGYSTKTNNMNVLGAFGLGCKSALTLTQQFTLVGVKDGIKTVALISRDEDGVGEASIVSTQPSDDPSGVKITIPIHDVHNFTRRSEGYFYGFEPGTVLVDGSEPSLLRSDPRVSKVAENVFYRPSTAWSDRGVYIIIENVVFPVSYSYISPRILEGNSALYIVVPIGAVDLTPSREEIRYSERTVSFLKELYTNSEEAVGTFLKDSVLNAPTAHAAVEACKSFIGAVRYTYHDKFSLVWGGEKVSTTYKTNGHSVIVLKEQYSRDSGMSLVSFKERSSQLVLFKSTYGPAFFIIVSDDKEEKQARRDFKGWALHTGVENPTDRPLHILSERPDSIFFTEEAFTEVSLDELYDGADQWRKASRKSRKTDGPQARREPSPLLYPVVTWDSEEGIMSHSEIAASDVPDDVYLIPSKDLIVFNDAVKFLHDATKDFKSLGVPSASFVVISTHRKVESFWKRAKQISERKTYLDFLEEVWDTIDTTSSVFQPHEMGIWSYEYDAILNLKGLDIHDPIISRLVESINLNSGVESERDSFKNISNSYYFPNFSASVRKESTTDHSADVTQVKSDYAHFMSVYPLARNRSSFSEDVLTYINAVYFYNNAKTTKEGKK